MTETDTEIRWEAGAYLRALGEAILDERNTSTAGYVKALQKRFPGKDFNKNKVLSAYRRYFDRLTDHFTEKEVAQIKQRYEANAERNRKKLNKTPIKRKAKSAPQSLRQQLRACAPPAPPPPTREELLAPLRDDNGKPYTAATITDGMCRWPYSDPEKKDFALCGRAAKGSYCPDHERQSKMQQSPRTPKAPSRADDLSVQLRKRDNWK